MVLIQKGKKSQHLGSQLGIWDIRIHLFAFKQTPSVFPYELLCLFILVQNAVNISFSIENLIPT